MQPPPGTYLLPKMLLGDILCTMMEPIHDITCAPQPSTVGAAHLGLLGLQAVARDAILHSLYKKPKFRTPRFICLCWYDAV